MDFASLHVLEDGILIKDIKHFELKDVFECGQCFRWNKTEENTYIGTAYGRVIEVKKQENDAIIYNTSEEDFNNIWREYFDLDRDYGEIIEELSNDPILKKSSEFGEGIRLLQQDPFEITISFIISANNRIPMIKRAIDNISKKWGKEILYKGKTYYTFPTLDVLAQVSLEEIESCGVGFRAKYIVDTIKKLYENEYDLNEIKKLNGDGCHEALKKFNGIGPKVSDCIMLFSMQKYSAFPVDVWVKRAMMFFYVAPDVSLPKIRKFGREKFGDLAGFAQQYLFYYAREKKIKID